MEEGEEEEHHFGGKRSIQLGLREAEQLLTVGSFSQAQNHTWQRKGGSEGLKTGSPLAAVVIANPS